MPSLAEQYAAQIRGTWKCPAGYRELVPNEPPCVVYDRTNLRPKAMVGWDGDRIELVGVVTSVENPCWYVVEVDIDRSGPCETNLLNGTNQNE